MIVVADATPIRHLEVIGELHIPHILYGEIIIPHTVHSELPRHSTPERVRLLIQNPPSWLQTRRASKINEPDLMPLHPGEREAIALATELTAELLIVDDHAGLKVAKARGLPVIQTLTVMEAADGRGLLPDFRSTLDALRASGFYISEKLYVSVLQRHRDRHR